MLFSHGIGVVFYRDHKFSQGPFIHISMIISLTSVYQTLRLFEETHILGQHKFRDDRSNDEASSLFNWHYTSQLIEFHDKSIEALHNKMTQNLGHHLVDS